MFLSHQWCVQQEDTQQFQRARQAGLITKAFHTAAGYLDQIAVMPTWYDMPFTA